MKRRVYLKCKKDNTVPVKKWRNTSTFFRYSKQTWHFLKNAPFDNTQLNSNNIILLSQKDLVEKLLDRILPLLAVSLAVSEALTRFAGLQPLYDGINLLDPVYCLKDEVLRMLEKCTGLNDS